MIFLPHFKPILLSTPAKKDLQLIAKYTEKEWGENQKHKYLALFNQFFKQLVLSGNIGSSRDDIAKELFCFSVRKHLVFYRETDTEFSIIRILYNRMDVKKHLIDH